MPLMYPRATATLVDSATARFLSRYGIPFEDLQPQDESALNRLLESQLPQSVEAALRDTEVALEEKMARVIEVMPAVDPTLAGAARTTLSKMEHELKGLHGKMIQAAKRRDETLRRQFTRAQAQIFRWAIRRNARSARLLPQSIRARRHRSAARRSCRSSSGSTGSSRSDGSSAAAPRDSS